MNVLFSGGDNWYPAIIGSKAVNIKLYLQNTTDQTLFSVISVAKIMV